MDQKNADGKKRSAENEASGEIFFRSRRERDEGLEEGEEQSQISGANHVDVRINFGAAGFEEIAEMRKGCVHSSGVFVSDGLRRGEQSGALLAGVLMQDEYGKDVPEEHSDSNKGDAAEYQETPRAHGREGSGGTVHNRLGRGRHDVFSIASQRYTAGFSSALPGLFFFNFDLTHGLRRGLHSVATSRPDYWLDSCRPISSKSVGSCRLLAAECRDDMFRKHLLGLDALPVINSSKIGNDGQFANATFFLQVLDLLQDFCRSADEGDFLFDDLFVG